MIRITKERYWLDIFITHWLRTAEEQNALYQQGRTKPWQIVTQLDWYKYLSDHQTGMAFDIAFRWLELYPKDQATRDKVWVIAYELWLKRWWREWKWDKPHFWLDEKVIHDNLDVEKIAKEVWEEYGISSDFLICVATAETSLGKNVKSSRNRLNTGNHDSWATKWFDSLKENFEYGAEALVNWPYLSKWSKIGELSCDGREKLWWEVCKQKKEDYFRASDETGNWINNVTKCMTKRLWPWDYLNFEYK